jgi:hypothetical protein
MAVLAEYCRECKKLFEVKEPTPGYICWDCEDHLHDVMIQDCMDNTYGDWN